MIDTPEITQTTSQETAVIHLTIPREEIRNVMGPGIGELMSAVAAQGIAPAGPVFSHHFKMDPKIFDFEIGVLVTRPVSPAGRVQPGQLPAPDLWEYYVAGPESSPDPAKWRTELNQPLV